MRIAIIGDANRKDQDNPLIEKASDLFEEVIYAPVTDVRVRTGKGNGVIYGNKILSAFECILPIPSSNIDIFLAIASALDDTDVYTPYTMESLLLFHRRVVGLAKLRELGFPTHDINYCLSDISVENVAETLKFPVDVIIGSRSAIVEDEKHLKGMVKLRRSGETILLKEPISGPVIECMVVGSEVVSIVEHNHGKKARSVNIGSSVQDLVVNATKALGSDYGFVSLNDNKIVSLSLSSNFSSIEKLTNRNVSRILLTHMKDNAKMVEKSILERIVDVLKVSK